ncbi:unnamed protein product [Clonostachys rosea f. rosea IK726]|uniref:Uncharacterized protein n=1 Tax=Clonostachys rosea f. rosea IK726 TaxID=1349383 RepID=A0ACA9UKU6_BIOOC|nr:unnamed protein product [Clonostachys rosea f. rosea IK726]
MGSRKSEDDPNVETIETTWEADADTRRQPQPSEGFIKLIQNDSVILIPRPSQDPKDPLNLPTWHKGVIIILVGLYSAISVLATSGLGAVFPYVVKDYPDQATRATDLLTYPTLFMGIGNLISMPLTLALGRRPIFLISLLMLAVTGLWCAFSTSLTSHIAGRNFLSMAAGQSEALAPFIVEEIHFLHERSTKIAWYIGVQAVGTAGMFVATTYIVPQFGLKWWYLIITFISLGLLVLSFFFVTETMYNRADDLLAESDPDQKPTTRESHRVRPEVYGPRTWKHDLKMFHYKANWSQVLIFYKQTAQGFCIPSILWLLLLNGACLGVYVYHASTFAVILMAEPYNFKSSWLGWVQLVQVLDCVLLIPIVGYGSDLLVKRLSAWRKGMFVPEDRFISLALPIVAVILACVIYGQAGAHPEKWHWMAIVAPYHIGLFAFMSANLVAITYSIDSFPKQGGALLMVICVGRGFISFGLSYSTVPLIDATGYDGAMNILAIVCGVLGAITIPMYFLGPRFRRWALKTFWTVDKSL